MQREAATIRIDHLQTKLFDVDTGSVLSLPTPGELLRYHGVFRQGKQRKTPHQDSCGWNRSWRECRRRCYAYSYLLAVDESAPIASLFYVAGCGKLDLCAQMPLESSIRRRCQNRFRMLKKARLSHPPNPGARRDAPCPGKAAHRFTFHAHGSRFLGATRERRWRTF